MIARNPGCDTSRLPRLLADTLPESESGQLTKHLESCSHCRGALEELAAAPVWWNDTREVLVELSEHGTSDEGLLSDAGLSCSGLSSQGSHADVMQPATSPTEASNSSEHWVLGLLEPPEVAGELGQLDGFRIEDVVGQGGMGVVLRAHDSPLHRVLAIKLLSPMLSSNGSARQRFFREAQSAASVVHPNIVPIYSVSGDRSLPYIVMPYVAGGNLQQLLDADGPLGIERVLSIGYQVAEGLAAAHAQGIIHRDIKPANLMLDGGGFRVMLTDFGLARALDDTTLTGSGMIAGTPQYMSPEQARGGAVDHRTDIYSLGAVLYTLATGYPPVHGGSTMELLRRIGEEKPAEVYAINPSYPKWFGQVVEQLMLREVERRPQSAAEVATLLRECLAHVRCPAQVALPASIAQPHRAGGSQTLGLRLGLSVAAIGLILACLMLIPDATGGRVRQFWDALSQDNQSESRAQPRTDPAQPQDSTGLQAAAESVATIESPKVHQGRPVPELPWTDEALYKQLDMAENSLRQLLQELNSDADK